MIKAILSDFSRVVLFPKDDSYQGGLNNLHKEKSNEAGYNFWDYYKVNEELLNYYRTLKNKYKIYCFTTGRIQEYPELNNKIKDVFEEIFTVEDINIQKNDFESYRSIINQLGYTPEEVVFIDDTLENIEAASKAGLKTINYEDNKSLIEKLDNIK